MQTVLWSHELKNMVKKTKKTSKFDKSSALYSNQQDSPSKDVKKPIRTSEALWM